MFELSCAFSVVVVFTFVLELAPGHDFLFIYSQQLVSVRKILQEYQESYKRFGTFLQEKDHLSCILQDLARILQESCMYICASFLQYSCKILQNSRQMVLFCKNVQVLQGYSCKRFLILL